MILAMASIVHFVYLFFIGNIHVNCSEIQASPDSFTNLSYNVCIYNKFCKSGTSSSTSGHFSCCAACTCSRFCYIGNRCCPDSDATNRNLKCRHQREYFDAHRGVDILTDDVNYYVHDSCSEDKRETENECLHPKVIEDHILVSDPNTLMVYKNAKCAECNGVNKYITWELFIFCPYGDEIFSAERRNEFVLENCGLVSKPPNHEKNIYKIMRCSPDVIDTCNATKEWDFYSEELERGCASYTMLYKEERLAPGNIVLNSRMFKNLYCYLCNKKKGSLVNSQCFQSVDVTSESIGELDIEFRATFIPFRNHNLIKKTCNVGEFEDSFTNTCRELYCPFGETAYYGTCIKLTKNIFMSLSFLYILNISSSEIDMENPEYSFGLFHSIVEGLEIITGRFSCDVCDLSLYTDNLFMIRARPSGKCSIQQLLKVFEHISKVSMPINTTHFGKMDIRLLQTNRYIDKIDKKNRFALTINGLDRIHFIQERTCLVGKHLTTKFYCDSIVFRVSEIRSKEILEKLLVFSDPHHFNGNIVDDYIVCLSDYRRVLNAVSGCRNTRSFLYTYAFVMILKLILHN